MKYYLIWPDTWIRHRIWFSMWLVGSFESSQFWIIALNLWWKSSGFIMEPSFFWGLESLNTRLQICPRKTVSETNKATDGTYRSKYWWNQGLVALIQGQIYNPSGFVYFCWWFFTGSIPWIHHHETHHHLGKILDSFIHPHRGQVIPRFGFPLELEYL